MPGILKLGILVNHLDEPSPIDPSDPAAALEALRAVDHDHFLDAVNKAGQTIRKWQKQCKDYREKAKGKISFRNFAKGDLALFLPTRNSVTKPWAAFNGAFPINVGLAGLVADFRGFSIHSVVPSLLPEGDWAPRGAAQDARMDRRSHYVHHGRCSRLQGRCYQASSK